SIASICLMPWVNACCRKSVEASMRMVLPSNCTRIDARRRLSLGSSDRQVSQSQPTVGIPTEGPVTKKVILIGLSRCQRIASEGPPERCQAVRPHRRSRFLASCSERRSAYRLHDEPPRGLHCAHPWDSLSSPSA